MVRAWLVVVRTAGLPEVWCVVLRVVCVHLILVFARLLVVRAVLYVVRYWLHVSGFHNPGTADCGRRVTVCCPCVAICGLLVVSRDICLTIFDPFADTCLPNLSACAPRVAA